MHLEVKYDYSKKSPKMRHEHFHRGTIAKVCKKFSQKWSASALGTAKKLLVSGETRSKGTTSTKGFPANSAWIIFGHHSWWKFIYTTNTRTWAWFAQVCCLLPKKNLMNSIIIFTSAKSWPCTKTTPPKLPTCKRPARAKEGALGWFHWVLGNRNLMEIIQHQYEQMKLMGGFLCQIWHAPCHHHHRHPPSSS